MTKEGCLGRSLEKKHKKHIKTTRAPIKSVLEESQVEDYLNHCSLSENIIVVHERSDNPYGLPSVENTASPSVPSVDYNNFISLPRKPSWEGVEDAASFKQLEEKEFYRWRSQLAALEQSNSHLIMTPFERSLDIWREFWKAIERADVLFQVLDARNPLFFYSPDVFKYSSEMRPTCKHFVILNKADLLNVKQRQAWSSYFTDQNINHVFFTNQPRSNIGNETPIVHESFGLCALIKSLVGSAKSTVSFVGYPNVGKSSTINSILGISKAAVSATPGKTKHIQTFECDGFTICDCPGLVFPNMTISKSELILNGVLSIDQMREYLSPVTLLCERIPIAAIEATYNIKITFEHHVSISESVLSAYARSRGMATSNFGNPDIAKASRIILKDYNAGKLLFCYPPPGENAKEFNKDNPHAALPSPDFSVVNVPTLDDLGNVGWGVMSKKGVKLTGKKKGGLRHPGP